MHDGFQNQMSAHATWGRIWAHILEVHGFSLTQTYHEMETRKQFFYEIDAAVEQISSALQV